MLFETNRFVVLAVSNDIIVDEAYVKCEVEEAFNPAKNEMAVDVALVLMPKFRVGVHGKAKSAPVLLIVVTAPSVEIDIPVPAAIDVEAVHVGMPPSQARTWPLVPESEERTPADESCARPVVRFWNVAVPETFSAVVEAVPETVSAEVEA